MKLYLVYLSYLVAYSLMLAGATYIHPGAGVCLAGWIVLNYANKFVQALQVAKARDAVIDAAAKSKRSRDEYAAPNTGRNRGSKRKPRTH